MSKLRKITFASLLLLLSSLAYSATVSAQEAHAIVDVSEGCLMGGVSGNEWLEADGIAPLLKGGERYRLY
ncbi:MAG TPA: hypothetical protein VF766_12285, partial [Pyrinomonadaceae bacterium]